MTLATSLALALTLQGIGFKSLINIIGHRNAFMVVFSNSANDTVMLIKLTDQPRRHGEAKPPQCVTKASPDSEACNKTLTDSVDVFGFIQREYCKHNLWLTLRTSAIIRTAQYDD